MKAGKRKGCVIRGDPGDDSRAQTKDFCRPWLGLWISRILRKEVSLFAAEWKRDWRSTK